MSSKSYLSIVATDILPLPYRRRHPYLASVLCRHHRRPTSVATIVRWLASVVAVVYILPLLPLLSTCSSPSLVFCMLLPCINDLDSVLLPLTSVPLVGIFRCRW